MNKIFIATSTFAAHSNEPLNILERQGFNIIHNPLARKLNANELVDHASNAAGIIAGTESYAHDVLGRLPKLRVLSRLGVGMDNIDLNAAKKKGIKVFRTDTTPAPAVSELTLGLMLDVARKISVQNQGLKSGIWKKKMGNLLYGKTLGIIGLGTIGKTLVNLVKGFNFKILAYDLYHDDKFVSEHRIKYCNMNTLLSKSDIISIHLNLSGETIGMMSREQITKMKPESILVNTSRGEIIDEEALYEALKKKKILGAGLDVFNDEPYSGPLKELNNVVLTPHIGSYAKEIRIQMEIEATQNLIKGLKNK